MPALRFELISWERYGRRGLAEIAGNQYPGGITTAGLYNVNNSAQRPFKRIGEIAQPRIWVRPLGVGLC